MVTRIGGAKSIQVDVRVLAATNKDLESEIAEGRFREDLLYRLNVVPIEVPPLRERLEDVPALVAHFAEQLGGRVPGCPGKKFAEDAVRRLQSRPWPGNIRELRNAVERALILASGKVVTAADIDRLLPAADGSAVRRRAAREARRRSRRSSRRRRRTSSCRSCGSTTGTSRRRRGRSRCRARNLYKKIERYGLSRESA